MPQYTFAPVPVASVPLQGEYSRFPVHRIYCVGRNFAEHAKEMGAPVEKGTPVIFMKPGDAIVTDGHVPYPTQTSDLHHEVELVVAIGRDARGELSAKDAMSLVFAYGVGLDLTRRDLQALAKAKSHPWDVAKGFDHSAPVSALRPAAEAQLSAATGLSLSVNGAVRQHSTLGEMVHDVAGIIAILSTLFELKAGDLIFTGTPAGVAALQRGDSFHAALEGVATLDGRIA